MKNIFNIDCDGVLLSNRLEEQLNNRTALTNCKLDDTSDIWDWYNKLVETTPVEVNDSFLKCLKKMKDDGNIIRLWTNRSYNLKDATLSNLGGWTSIFDSVSFHSGRKHLSNVEGTVVDNHAKYLSCGQNGILYPEFL